MKSTESKTVQITAAVKSCLKNIINTKIKNKILIAFSSGPDSSVLLDVLWKLSGELNLEIVCAYYNHKLRTNVELEREIAIAQENCRVRNIKFIQGTDSGGINKDTADMGIEAAARKHRYIFLEKIYRKERCTYTATGHNFDDQIETVIMRLFKGSGASGLKGISDRNGVYIRPLISVSKKDILEYIKENKIKYSFDKSNDKEIYLRNRIRKKIIPEVRDIFPGFGNSIKNLSEKMRLTERYIKEEAEKKIVWKETDEGLSTDYDNFFLQQEIICLESLYSAVNRIKSDGYTQIPYTFFKPLLCQTSSCKEDKNNNFSKKSNVFLEGYGLILFRTGKFLYFKRTKPDIGQKPFTVDLEDKKRIYPIYKNRYIYVEEKMVSECSPKDLFINPCIIKGRLFIRYREHGDRISLRGGTKKIKKLFTDLNIQKDHKDKIPLICDSTGILAVMGSLFGYKDRIAEKIYVDKSTSRKVVVFRTRQV